MASACQPFQPSPSRMRKLRKQRRQVTKIHCWAFGCTVRTCLLGLPLENRPPQANGQMHAVNRGPVMENTRASAGAPSGHGRVMLTRPCHPVSRNTPANAHTHKQNPRSTLTHIRRPEKHREATCLIHDHVGVGGQPCTICVSYTGCAKLP